MFRIASDIKGTSMAGQKLLGGNCECFEKQILISSSFAVQEPIENTIKTAKFIYTKEAFIYNRQYEVGKIKKGSSIQGKNQQH
jgi:hypothetical protein